MSDADVMGVPATSVLERGDAFFFYRPRVDVDHVRGFDDIARLFLVLRPREPRRYRLLIVGQKRMPATTREGDRLAWALVYRVSDRPDEIEDELDPETYGTRTRGERREPPARPAGEAVYALVRHDDHVHAAYVLELPAQPGDVQHALGIEREASYIVQVRNPEAPGPTGFPRRGRVTLPPDLQRRFGNRRFTPLDPPTFLDHEGVELLLIGASPDIEAELGLSLDAQRETEASAEIFRDLRIERDLHPTAPLFEGRWE